MDDVIKETLKKFIKWTKLKVRIHLNFNEEILFKQREIWWASIGLNIGSEQNGKNDAFERPVLVVRKFGQRTFLSAPLTTKKKLDQYRHEIKYYEYRRDIHGEVTGEERSGIIILNQLKTISSKRLIRKIGVMSELEFNQAREMIRNTI
jgi:mRNA-degrading endonuclease toxin of MazEF toxin-antitoxin module